MPEYNIYSLEKKKNEELTNTLEKTKLQFVNAIDKYLESPKANWKNLQLRHHHGNKGIRRANLLRKQIIEIKYPEVLFQFIKKYLTSTLTIEDHNNEFSEKFNINVSFNSNSSSGSSDDDVNSRKKIRDKIRLLNGGNNYPSSLKTFIKKEYKLAYDEYIFKKYSIGRRRPGFTNSKKTYATYEKSKSYFAGFHSNSKLLASDPKLQNDYFYNDSRVELIEDFFNTYNASHFFLFLFDNNRLSQETLRKSLNSSGFDFENYWYDGYINYKHLFSKNFDHDEILSIEYLEKIYKNLNSQAEIFSTKYIFNIPPDLMESYNISNNQNQYLNKFGMSDLLYIKSYKNKDYISKKKDVNKEDLINAITYLLTHYEYKVKFLKQNNYPPITFIYTIVEMISVIDKLHIFPDGNIRTCVFLLNKELVRFNLLPSILDDPNSFDDLPPWILTYQVMLGQLRTSIYMDMMEMKKRNFKLFFYNTNNKHIEKIYFKENKCNMLNYYKIYNYSNQIKYALKKRNLYKIADFQPSYFDTNDSYQNSLDKPFSIHEKKNRYKSKLMKENIYKELTFENESFLNFIKEYSQNLEKESNEIDLKLISNNISSTSSSSDDSDSYEYNRNYDSSDFNEDDNLYKANFERNYR